MRAHSSIAFACSRSSAASPSSAITSMRFSAALAQVSSGVHLISSFVSMAKIFVRPSLSTPLN